MTYDVLFDLGLAGVLIAIAAGAIFARRAFVSLVLFMGYGLLLRSSGSGFPPLTLR